MVLARTATSEMPNAAPVRMASGPGSARYYRTGLDCLRCLAFLLVLAHHTMPRSVTGIFSVQDAVKEFSAAGVCLFFTLSAFLITELLLREMDGTGTIHVRAFYIRRILRIWPLYLAMVVLGVALPHLNHSLPSAKPFILPYLFMAGNWALAFHGNTRNMFLEPLWSISVEEQFYLIWPSLFLFWRKRGVIIASLIILPVAWATDYVLPALHIPKEPALWCNSFSQFQFFGVGGLLALYMHRRSLKITVSLRLLILATAAGCFFLAAFPFHFQNPLIFTSPGYVVGGYMSIDLGCLLLLVAFLDMNIPSAGRPLIYLGKISYGLYVFHMFILVMVKHFNDRFVHLSPAQQIWLNWSMTVVIAIPVAYLSYEYFEKPFLRIKERYTFVASRAV